MIEQLAKRTSGFLVEHGADSSQQEVYTYSMECILNLLCSDILLFTAGVLLHQLPALIVWDISYMLIRTNIGGYHAGTHERCILAGTMVGLLSLPLNRLWEAYPALTVVLFAALAGDILFLAPVRHERRPVSPAGKKKAKLHAALITTLGFLIAFLLIHKGMVIGNAVFSGFACALILSLYAALQNARKGVVSNVI